MKKFFTFLITLVLLNQLSLISQVDKFINVPTHYPELKESFPIVINENEFLVFYINLSQDSIFSIRTRNKGSTWENPVFVHKVNLIHEQAFVNLAGLKTNSGRLLLAWSAFRDSISIIRSDDNGVSWRLAVKLSRTDLPSSTGLNFSQLSNNDIILTSRDFHFGISRLSYRISPDNGDIWSDAINLKYNSGEEITGGFDFSYESNNSNNVFGIFLRTSPSPKRIYGLKASLANLDKPDTSSIFETAEDISRLKLIKTGDGRLWIIYQLFDATALSSYSQYDIYYITSEDNGDTWSEPVRFTYYLGSDHTHNVSELNNLPLITFVSSRFTNKNQFALGQAGYTNDLDYPPYIINSRVVSVDNENQTFNVRSDIIHDKKDFDVDVFIFDNHFIGRFYDDGQHNDKEADDFIYGNDFSLPDLPPTKNYLLNVNNIKLPVSNSGVMSDVVPSIDIKFSIKVNYKNKFIISDETEFSQNAGSWGARYDDIGFLFSSGLVLSGLDNGIAWANTTNSFNPKRDYIPGPVGSTENDPQNRFYVVRADDPPFGRAWQDWKNAVELGADFYDGDGDGIYNPVDRNLNGTWDRSEDMPLIIGDETAWFVYNDGVPDSQKVWRSESKQIEVAQTIFASNKPGFENIIFLRFTIKNKSESVYDSVYFGLWADPDIGSNYQEDLVACDTLLNSVFAYKYGTDPAFGVNPPAFFTTILQGPVVNSYLSSDTAYIRLGQQIGETALPSANNLEMTSHFAGLKSLDPDFRDPDNVNTVRNYFRGLTRSGKIVDPCTFYAGEVHGGIDCSQINPAFIFSGDPVQQLGWLLKYPWDIRNMVNTGPFILSPDESQEIIAAYVVARGVDNLNSITVTRENVTKAIEEYNNNFSSLAYSPPPPIHPAVTYILHQNFPNPFNPSTRIRFEIPDAGFVTLKVYDILGREVKTLINEFRNYNRYEIVFDGSGLASGVYFYQLRVNDFIETKKMALIR
jgi:hypothetical protein